MQLQARFTSVGNWCSRRAWSRAGAIAAVLATGAPRRVLALTQRVVLLVLGSALIAGSVATTLWTQLGPGPLDVFIGAVRSMTGLPLTFALWLTVGTLIAVAWLLGRRPGLGTLTAPLMIGPMMQGALAVLDGFAAPSAWPVAVTLHLLAIGALGIGAGALIVSGLGAGSGELLASAASDRSGRAEPHVRMAIELGWLALGVILGGPAGLGTVIVALCIGPAVANGYRIVDSTATRSRHQLAITRRSILSAAASA